MNRLERRKAITQLARKAIKDGSIEVPMGLGQQVVNRIATLQGVTHRPQMRTTQLLDHVAMTNRVDNSFKLKVLKLWTKIKKALRVN